MVASGALAFDGLGWLWEKPLVGLGIIRPELFTTVIKTLTLKPREGNLRWWKPWDCVRLIPGGSVNKVGLTNLGFKWWEREVGPRLNYHKYPLVGSIFGTEDELVYMAEGLNAFNLRALEINPSCPNTGHKLEAAETVIRMVRLIRKVSRHPLIIKVSVNQDYLAIASGLRGFAEAISLNSVPWEIVFPGKQSPLWRLEKRVGGGGGGVSGQPAKLHNWKAARELCEQESLPVIGPDIMGYEDLACLRALGAKAFSFGAVHLRTPWRPTTIVQRDRKERLT